MITKDIHALTHTSNITLDCTLTTTGDFHPSYFWSNSLLRGRMFIRLSDGESQKLKCAKIPLNFRKGKLGTVKVNIWLTSQQCIKIRLKLLKSSELVNSLSNMASIGAPTSSTVQGQMTQNEIWTMTPCTVQLPLIKQTIWR